MKRTLIFCGLLALFSGTSPQARAGDIGPNLGHLLRELPSDELSSGGGSQAGDPWPTRQLDPWDAGAERPVALVLTASGAVLAWHSDGAEGPAVVVELLHRDLTATQRVRIPRGAAEAGPLALRKTADGGVAVLWVEREREGETLRAALVDLGVGVDISVDVGVDVNGESREPRVTERTWAAPPGAFLVAADAASPGPGALVLAAAWRFPDGGTELDLRTAGGDVLPLARESAGNVTGLVLERAGGRWRVSWRTPGTTAAREATGPRIRRTAPANPLWRRAR
jgi:hypothetical protein